MSKELQYDKNKCAESNDIYFREIGTIFTTINIISESAILHKSPNLCIG